MAFLPSNLTEEVNSNPEVLSGNTESLQPAWSRWKDKNGSVINLIFFELAFENFTAERCQVYITTLGLT